MRVYRAYRNICCYLIANELLMITVVIIISCAGRVCPRARLSPDYRGRLTRSARYFSYPLLQ